jgi:hypothetical protein
MDSLHELLANSLKRKEELQKESETLDRLIELCRRMITDEESVNTPAQLGLWETRNHKQRLKANQIQEMMAEVKRLILAERRPLKRGELVKRLEDRGFEIVGTDKSKVLGTNVWRSKQFVHIDGEGYWPSDIELPSEFDRLLG